MKQASDHSYILTLTVRNRPGVLVRCAQVFGRRGHNIEALHVTADKSDNNISTMQITAYGAKDTIQQIVAQLGKLVDVLNVTEEEMYL
jgi:acetolactate synthase-1/3 small subunit